jgi:hypothetical protein
MRLFKCPACDWMLYFEATQCDRCARTLGYDETVYRMRALERDGELWTDPDGTWRFCDNAAHGACNWLLPASAQSRTCGACRHNSIIPDLSNPRNLPRWRALEAAKHRLIYGLQRLHLPLRTRAEDPEHGLAFEFLAEMRGQPHVITGHDNGLITINILEGDDTERTRIREQLGEAYRTPLGHFRHEVGHHYWDLLVRDGGHLDAFRAMFGDERADYDAALKHHYETPHNEDWQNEFVSYYASSHPWEDFAETWAHYMHIVDALETAANFGISIHPTRTRDPALQADIDFDPYRATDMAAIIEAWQPLTFAMNNLNRSLGQPDLYPFVLSDRVVDKLGFVHEIVR